MNLDYKLAKWYPHELQITNHQCDLLLKIQGMVYVSFKQQGTLFTSDA